MRDVRASLLKGEHSSNWKKFVCILHEKVEELWPIVNHLFIKRALFLEKGQITFSCLGLYNTFATIGGECKLAQLLQVAACFWMASWLICNLISSNFPFPWKKFNMHTETFILKSRLFQYPSWAPFETEDTIEAILLVWPDSEQPVSSRKGAKQYLSDMVLSCKQELFLWLKRTGKSQPS